MQAETIYSFLVWDNPTIVPFPDEIKETIAKVDWNKHEWQTYGLPIAFGKYSFAGGKTLYLDELADGQSSVEKQDSFTGKIMANDILSDRKS